MYRKIIVGYDASERAEDALALAAVLRDALGAELVVAGVVDLEPLGGLGVPAHFDPEAQRESARERIRPAAERLGAEVEVVTGTSAAHGLTALAEGTDSDLIVIGSCRRSLPGRVMAGSVGERLLQGSSCAVIVAPARYGGREHYGVRTVACGIVATDDSRVALAAATELARAAGATLKLVSVAPDDTVLAGKGFGVGPVHEAAEAARVTLESELARARDQVPEDLRVEVSLRRGDAVEELATTDADLLVVGSRRYGPVRTVMLGGVSLPLVRCARLPVLVAPRPAGQPERSPEVRSAGVTG